MLFRRIMALASVCLICSNASAELTLEKYREGMSSNRDIRGMAIAYVAGVGAAYTWANSELERERQPLLFCQPRTLALNSDVLLRLLDREIQNDLYKPQYSVEMALLFALKRNYPCQ